MSALFLFLIRFFFFLVANYFFSGEWKLSSTKGKIVLAFTAIAGVLVGALAAGAGFGVWWYCKNKEDDYSFELAPDSIVL